MNCEIIRAKEFVKNTWSGGTTTQLFIYPLEAEYKKRDFLFRISTATVEVETSQFTMLPGVSRKLMVLDGKMKLVHENQYTQQLAKFEVDSFNGDWNTTSYGKCKDFNLMTTGKTNGELSALCIEKNEKIEFNISEFCHWVLIYNYTGNVEIYSDDVCYTLNAGDLFIVNEITTSTLLFAGIENSTLVISEINS